MLENPGFSRKGWEIDRTGSDLLCRASAGNDGNETKTDRKGTENGGKVPDNYGKGTEKTQSALFPDHGARATSAVRSIIYENIRGTVLDVKQVRS